MVYFLNGQCPYEVSLGVRIFDDRRKHPLYEMRFLHPEAVKAERPSLFFPNADRMGTGFPVVMEDAPKKLAWNGGNRKLPDVLKLGGVLIVCAKLRDLIEQFDPGRHQLIPVEVYKSKKKPPEATYYWFNICTRIDSVDEHMTTWTRNLRDDGSIYLWEWGYGERFHELFFSRRKIGNHHVWIDRALPSTYWCSEKLGNAARDIGVIGLLLNPFNETD